MSSLALQLFTERLDLDTARPSPKCAPLDRPSTMSSSSDSDDNDYDDWTEEPTPTRSLFDSQTSASALEAIESDSGRHGFHLLDFSASLGLDFYNYLRLVNFVRAEKPSVQSLKELKREATVFEDEKWLKPVLEDDGLLRAHFPLLCRFQRAKTTHRDRL